MYELTHPLLDGNREGERDGPCHPSFADWWLRGADSGRNAGPPLYRQRAGEDGGIVVGAGVVQEEDISIKKIVGDYAKASGNTIDLSIMPFAPMRQKIVSAMTSGVVPDMFTNQPTEIISLFAWDDRLVDVSDVVATQREELSETALTNMNCYNNVTKKRSFYGAPYTQGALPNHVWRPLVEKAGFKIEDIPKTWDAYYDFFKE